MKEIFVIYNKITGLIKSSGRIDREWDSNNLDGSTVTEYIGKKVADTNLEVLYLSNQILPDREKYKVDRDGLVEMTAEEIVETIQPRLDEYKIEAEMSTITRFNAIQSLKAKGELAEDYKEIIRS